MIEGLKVTVLGTELKQLCLQRAAHHSQRAASYENQIKSLEEAKVGNMKYSGGDPVKTLKDKQFEHLAGVAELSFIADHLRLEEWYLLDRQDLAKLGISKSYYE